MSVRLRLLGKVAIEVDGQVVSNFRSKKIALLLGLLAYRNGSWTRQSLASRLWPDSFKEDALHNLRQVVFELKQSVGTNLIISDKTSIELSQDVSVDLKDLLEFGDSTSDKFGLESLLCSPLSEFLEGYEEDWIVDIRAECSRSYIKGLQSLTDSLSDSSPERALECVEMAIRVDPLHEPTRVRKIKLLRKLGLNVEAHKEFVEFSKKLLDELGIESSAILKEAFTDAPKTDPESNQLHGKEVEMAIRKLLESDRPLQALEFGAASVPYWVEKGEFERGLKLLSDLRDANANNLKSLVFQNGTIAFAELLALSGKLPEANEILQSAKEILSEAVPKVKSLSLRARIELAIFRPKGALEIALEGLKACDERSLPDVTIDLLSTAAQAAAQLELPSQAAEYFDRCQLKCIEQGDWYTHANIILTFAGRIGAQGDNMSALIMVQRAADLLVDKSSVAASRCRVRVSRILEALGHDKEAEEGYRKGVAEANARNDRYSESIALTYLGDLLFKTNRLDESFIHHSRALHIRRDLGEKLGMATSLRGIGRVNLALAKFEKAHQALSEGAQLFLSCGAEPGYVSVLFELAKVAEETKDNALALRLITRTKGLLAELSLAEIGSIGPLRASIVDECQSMITRISNRVKN